MHNGSGLIPAIFRQPLVGDTLHIASAYAGNILAAVSYEGLKMRCGLGRVKLPPVWLTAFGVPDTVRFDDSIKSNVAGAATIVKWI